MRKIFVLLFIGLCLGAYSQPLVGDTTSRIYDANAYTFHNGIRIVDGYDVDTAFFMLDTIFGASYFGIISNADRMYFGSLNGAVQFVENPTTSNPNDKGVFASAIATSTTWLIPADTAAFSVPLEGQMIYHAADDKIRVYTHTPGGSDMCWRALVWE